MSVQGVVVHAAGKRSTRRYELWGGASYAAGLCCARRRGLVRMPLSEVRTADAHAGQVDAAANGIRRRANGVSAAEKVCMLMERRDHIGCPVAPLGGRRK